MTQTDRLKLKLIDGTDNVSVETFNDNMEKIDSEMLSNQNITDYIFPVGSIILDVRISSTPPGGWLFCRGQALKISEYQKLYNEIGRNFTGADVPSDSFRVPDFKGRFPLGVGSKWNEYGDNPGFYNLGDYGGEETVKLTINEIPSHTHNYIASAAGQVQTGGSSTEELLFGDLSPNTATTSVGGNVPHNNMPPHCNVNFIIKY